MLSENLTEVLNEMNQRLIDKRVLLQTLKDERERVRSGVSDVLEENKGRTVEEFNYQIEAEKKVIKEVEIFIKILEVEV